MNIESKIDREELLQRLDLRIRTMSELMLAHQKYIVSLSVSGDKRNNTIKQIETANKDFLEAVAEIDKDTVEHFDKLRLEYGFLERDNDNS
jgi:hypothetical protein